MLSDCTIRLNGDHMPTIYDHPEQSPYLHILTRALNALLQKHSKQSILKEDRDIPRSDCLHFAQNPFYHTTNITYVEITFFINASVSFLAAGDLNDCLPTSRSSLLLSGPSLNSETLLAPSQFSRNFIGHIFGSISSRRKLLACLYFSSIYKRG